MRHRARHSDRWCCHYRCACIHQADVRVDGAVVTDDDVVLDVGEGIDRHTGADLGARCDEGLWTDHSDRGLLGTSAEGIIEVDDGLHLAEAVAYLGRAWPAGVPAGR